MSQAVEKVVEEAAAKFTPGPYYVGPESHDRYNDPYTEIRFDRQYSEGSKPATYILGRVSYPRTHPNTVGTLERQATARLWAAAPDLYEAVTALLQKRSACSADPLNPCWNGRPTDKPGLHWASEPGNPVKSCPECTARAALAKAEGR